MDNARLMELISLQRHDFLNHFQVISGLLQMDRGEQAREYLNTAARNITRLSRIVHLKVSEAAAAILLAHYGAAERGIDVEYEIKADLDGCTVPAGKLASALESILLYSAECLASPENKHRVMKVLIHLEDGGYRFRVQYKTPPGVDGDDGVLRGIDDNLLLYGGSVKKFNSADETEIFVFLPGAD